MECLETRRLLASVPFSVQPAIATTADGAMAAVAADIDGDGNSDVLVASGFDHTIAWYPQLQAAGTFGGMQVIDSTAYGARRVRAADLDGDGDLDVLSASHDDNTIAWYENQNGLGSFGLENTLSTTATGAADVQAVDIDRDGDLDVLAASTDDDTIAWYENGDGAGTFGAAQVISSTAEGARGVFAADLDGDGDADVLAASADDNTIAWFENIDGEGTFGSAQAISTNATDARAVHAADVDGDGDSDVLAASYADDTIAWYENTNGAGTFGPKQTITSSADGASSIVAIDLDMDGDLDVMSASTLDDTIAWYENTDGTGNFAAASAISISDDGAASAVAIDLDGDGDTDVLGASRDDDTIAWYRNETIHRGAAFTDPSIGTISPNEFGARHVSLVDIDGDRDLDAIYAFTYYGIIAWYENIDGEGTFEYREIDTSTPTPLWFAGRDIDRDGDNDLVVSFVEADTIVWYENTDSAGTFGPQQIISQSQDNPGSGDLVDLDGDGDVDVVAGSFVDETLVWYENVDGMGTFAPAQLISDSAGDLIAVHAADVDGDGDADLLAATFYGNTVLWYENTDGTGNFGPKQVITDMADGAVSVHAADLDGDGDLDVLAASFFDDTVAWFENLDGQGTFGPEQVLNSNADGASWVSAADLDQDGDLDVVWCALLDQDDVAWHENLDGTGQFAAAVTVSRRSVSVNAFDIGDIDGDGDLDILPAVYRKPTTVWYENRGGQVAMPTSDTALPAIVEGRADDILRIDMVHRGRAGDHDEQLVSLALRLEEAEEDPLISAEANALIDRLDIYRDNGSGTFEADTDTLVATVETLNLTGGLETISFADGDPNLQVAVGSPATFFVVARLTPDATEQPVHQFRVTHVTEGPSGSNAEDAEANIPITIQLPQNVSSMIVGAALLGDMDRDGDLDLDDVEPFVQGLTDAAAYEDQHGLPSSVHGDIDGDGDHDLDDVDPFVSLLTSGQGSGQAESAGGGAASQPEHPAVAGATAEALRVTSGGHGSVQTSHEGSQTVRLRRPLAATPSGEWVSADGRGERPHEGKRPAAVLAGTRFARGQNSTDVEQAAVWRPDEDWLRRGFFQDETDELSAASQEPGH